MAPRTEPKGHSLRMDERTAEIWPRSLVPHATRLLSPVLAIVMSYFVVLGGVTGPKAFPVPSAPVIPKAFLMLRREGFKGA